MAEVEPTFLGFGAFETTAFCTSVIVACYSLIPNPTGKQGSTDQAEYQVYAGWRQAMLTILAQITLMALVTAQQIAQRTTGANTKAWLLALMVAPWAPLAANVRDTLTSGNRVRRMMQSRLTRNELAALLRDRFKFGQRGLAIPSVTQHLMENDMVPHALHALQENTALRKHETALRRQATEAAQTDDMHALEVGALWVMNQGPQPRMIPRWRTLTTWVVMRLDILARKWTIATIPLRASAMPNVHSVLARAYILDVVDELQQGGTVSDDVHARMLAGKFCDRCVLATRAAVEAFLESSERGHTDMRAATWLRHIDINWLGPFERIIDAMWEAAFMDNAGAKVPHTGVDKSRDFGDRAKATTTRTLALLFLTARAVMAVDKESETYHLVSGIVRDGPFTFVWWERYWRYFVEAVGYQDRDGGMVVERERVNDTVRGDFKATLRKMIDEDVTAIVDEFVKTSNDMSVCSFEHCKLYQARIVFTRCT